MIEVRLTWSQIDLAAQVGCKRFIRAMAKGRTERHGAQTRDGWGLHVIGAIAESAAAVALDVYWPASTDPDYAGDLTGNIHVRSTPRPDGRLILHPNDADDGDFFLVTTAKPPLFRVVGHIMGSAGKKQEFWDTTVPSPAYFVPQSALREISR